MSPREEERRSYRTESPTPEHRSGRYDGRLTVQHDEDTMKTLTDQWSCEHSSRNRPMRCFAGSI